MSDVAPIPANRTLPRRLPNSMYRQREYLTEAEVERLIEAVRKRGRNGPRDQPRSSWRIVMGYEPKNSVRCVGHRST
jgi:integrase